MKEKKQSDVSVLLGYAGSYKGLTFLGWAWLRGSVPDRREGFVPPSLGGTKGIG